MTRGMIIWAPGGVIQHVEPLLRSQLQPVFSGCYGQHWRSFHYRSHPLGCVEILRAVGELGKVGY